MLPLTLDYEEFVTRGARGQRYERCRYFAMLKEALPALLRAALFSCAYFTPSEPRVAYARSVRRAAAQRRCLYYCLPA